MTDRTFTPAQPAFTQEDVYANCWTTLIGFRDELTEQNRKFICDQIARKVMLAAQPPAGPVETDIRAERDQFERAIHQKNHEIAQLRIDNARLRDEAFLKSVPRSSADNSDALDKIAQELKAANIIESDDDEPLKLANRLLTPAERDLVVALIESRHTQPQALSNAVLETTSNMAAAVENLARHQEQCDMDGVTVKVSRQALDEVLSGVEAINGFASAMLHSGAK